MEIVPEIAGTVKSYPQQSLLGKLWNWVLYKEIYHKYWILPAETSFIFKLAMCLNKHNNKAHKLPEYVDQYADILQLKCEHSFYREYYSYFRFE